MNLRAIDAFTFLGESLFGYGQTADELLARMDAADVERAIVCSVRPRGYHLAPANDVLAEAAARQPRFVGLTRVDPNLDDEAVVELDRGLLSLGLRGLFLHPWEENFRINSARVDPLLARCAAFRCRWSSRPVIRGFRRRRRWATWRVAFRTYQSL